MKTTLFIKTMFLSALLLGWSNISIAQQGTFTAVEECEATKAIRRDNPGNISITAGDTYRLLDQNKEPPTHYLIDIPNAPVTSRRWVGIECGTIDADAKTTTPTKPKKKASKTTHSVEPDSIENVLAASWQPTFCATNRGSEKKECRSQTASRADATQFSIHGLWPDDLNDKDIFPCYCNSGEPLSCRTKRKAVKKIALSNKLMDQLETLMPGVQSGLHLHEWSKHGTCYEDFVSGEDNEADAEEYYAETVSLVNQLNGSPVRELFVKRLGKEITLKQLKNTFDDAFGNNAGDRVFMNCSRIKGKDYISELWISLGGAISLDSDIGELIQNAPTTDSSSSRKPCFKGIVSKVN